MKRTVVQYIGLYFLGLVMLVLWSFTPIKYATYFKKEKKKVDTLSVITPYVQIFADNNQYQVEDIELSLFNQGLFDSITKDLLQKKYILNHMLLTPNNIEFYKLFDSLENSPKVLHEISAENLFKNSEINWKSKYALILIFHSKYHPDFPPHFTRDAAFMSGTIVISPHNPIKSESDLRLLVINTEYNEIVFYDKVNSSQYDPRLPNEIENMVRQILKKIYYK